MILQRQLLRKLSFNKFADYSTHEKYFSKGTVNIPVARLISSLKRPHNFPNNATSTFTPEVWMKGHLLGQVRMMSTSSTNEIYKQLNADDLSYFSEKIGHESVVTDEDELKIHNTDWTNTVQGNSKALLRPRTSDEISEILYYCNKERIAVCPQGGNTGLVHGSVPVKDEVILSMSRLNKVISFNEITGILVCEAGCILQALDQYISDFGYTMPLDLGAKGSCHIGGNISTNAGGLHYIRYGTLHGSVLGLEVILPSGEKLDLLSTLRKDNTGYDLKHLFIGAEGALGIITKVAILCPKKPDSRSVALVGLETMDHVMETLKLAKSHLSEVIHAVEFIDSAAMELVQSVFQSKCPIDHFPFYMLLEAAGVQNSHVEERLSDMISHAVDKNYVTDGTITSESRKMQEIWSLREKITEAAQRSGQVLKYDLSLPLEQFYTPVLEMRERFGSKATHCMGYGHLGDGNLHLNIVVPKKTHELISLAEPFVYELTSKFRGSISAEHGLGAMKNQHIYFSKSPNAVEYMKKIKSVFDPNGILNPYKTLP